MFGVQWIFQCIWWVAGQIHFRTYWTRLVSSLWSVATGKTAEQVLPLENELREPAMSPLQYSWLFLPCFERNPTSSYVHSRNCCCWIWGSSLITMIYSHIKNNDFYVLNHNHLFIIAPIMTIIIHFVNHNHYHCTNHDSFCQSQSLQKFGTLYNIHSLNTVWTPDHVHNVARGHSLDTFCKGKHNKKLRGKPRSDILKTY